MPLDAETTVVSKKMLWAGWIVSAVPVAMLVMSGVMKVLKADAVVKGFADLGWPDSLALVLGITELTCTALYVIPQTAVLGAILLTGYLGGATATHARLEQSQFLAPVVLGVMVWLGLFLRDVRIRALAPIRSL